MAAGVVRSVDVGERRLLALTFDDGPSEWTEDVLGTLERHGERATFFVLGRQVAGREETLRRALAGGHELGNHTWSHARAGEISEEELRGELAQTSAAVEAATGIALRLARPPYGAVPERFAEVASGLGLAPTVLWSVDPEDWGADTAAAIVERVVGTVHPGAIVDLHDGWGWTRRSRQPTVDALSALLPALAAGDWELVTVSELLAAGGGMSAQPPVPRKPETQPLG